MTDPRLSRLPRGGANSNRFHRFFSSPVGSGFIGRTSIQENMQLKDQGERNDQSGDENGSEGENGDGNENENGNGSEDINGSVNGNGNEIATHQRTRLTTPEEGELEELRSTYDTHLTVYDDDDDENDDNDNNIAMSAHHNDYEHQHHASSILHQHRENHHYLRSPPSTTPLDAYLFGASDENYGEVAEMDAITQLQSEHDAYIAILETTHQREIQVLRKEIEDLKTAYASSSANQNLQLEIERSLVSMRTEIESSVRAELEEERRKEKEETELRFKDTMSKEVEKVSEAIREEAKSQMHAQLQSMRAQLEAQIRGELQTETERKVRLALVQQMRPQVRSELENALRLEIRTAYSQEIRKEVEATLVPELEKRIISEYKTKNARVQATQKEQAEAALQTQLAVAKKEMEEHIRRDAEAKVARKLAKQMEADVRVRVEKLRQELKAECEAEARKHVEASLAQIKQERAEIARLRAVENVRRTRDDAVHKDAEADFHKKVAEFRKHVQEEEARIARMKAVVQWKDEHVRRPASSLSNNVLDVASPTSTTHITSPLPTPTPAPAPAPNPTPPPPAHASKRHNATPPPARNPSPKHTVIPHTTPTPPSKPSTMVSTTMPEITTSPLTTPSPPNYVYTVPSPSQTVSPTQNEHTIVKQQQLHTPNKPAGVAFDFTFDVKLIAAKLISDARDIVQPQDSKDINATPSNFTPPPTIPAVSINSQQSTPSRLANRSPSPVRSHTMPEYSLGHIATEQRAQREFENQPVIPPQGTLGARLRVLLPRLYQLWDESEVSHVHRLDFCTGIRSLDVSSAERRVAMEIARLRKTFPSIQKEMALVARRESIKAQLARDDEVREGKGGKMDKILGTAEKGLLQAELRRITTAAHAAIMAWEAAHNSPFLYRGFPYLSLLSHQ